MPSDTLTEIAPFTAGSARLALAGGGGALVVLALGLSLTWLFVAVAGGFVVFGVLLAYAVWRGRTWNPERA